MPLYRLRNLVKDELNNNYLVKIELKREKRFQEVTTGITDILDRNHNRTAKSFDIDALQKELTMIISILAQYFLLMNKIRIEKMLES